MHNQESFELLTGDKMLCVEYSDKTRQKND